MISGAPAVRDAYRSRDVARKYVDERFREPLGALLHRRQLAAIASVIEQAAPKRVLEIAPGPARVTRDIARLLPGGIIVDASRQMLTEAVAHLKDTGWRAVQGDAFDLPVAGSFDLVFSFRLIRHFEIDNRLRLYREVRRVLRPGGYFVFDAVNERVSAPLRRRAPEAHDVFDALLRPEQIRQELSDAGFGDVALLGVQHRYGSLSKIQVLIGPRSRRIAAGLMDMIDTYGGGEPLEWVVVCRRT
jgi:ubiquinone/menaquinone biosynthesis C-methylase UbiE